MKTDLLAAILTYYQSDTTLQTLLGGTANIDTKIAYALLPPCYPSVTLHLDDDTGDPRAGYNETGVMDNSAVIAFHTWSHDEGLKIGSTYYDANQLQMEITDRLGVLSMNIGKVPAIYAVAGLRDVSFNSTPLPFEEDTHVHHTRSLLKFAYATIDTL